MQKESAPIIEAQKVFYRSGMTMSITERKKRLRRFKFTIHTHEKAILKALNEDLGKSDFESYTSEVLFVLKEIRLQSRHLKRWSTPQRVSGSWINFPSRDYLVPEPFGSILMISPWNYPFQLALTPLVGAVAAGNTVVLKPSESAPKTGAIVAQIIEEAFPKEWVTVVEGGAAVAQELLELSWDYIFYTGSTTVGKLVAQVAAKNLIPTTLELGGKSPCIVEDSAPLKSTAKRIVWGKFLNCGQTCIAPDYVLVSPHKKEALMTALKKEIIHAFGENPAKSKDYGRIINEIHIERLKENLKNQNIFYGGYFEEKQRYAGPTLVDLSLIHI